MSDSNREFGMQVSKKDRAIERMEGQVERLRAQRDELVTELAKTADANESTA